MITDTVRLISIQLFILLAILSIAITAAVIYQVPTLLVGALLIAYSMLFSPPTNPINFSSHSLLHSPSSKNLKKALCSLVNAFEDFAPTAKSLVPFYYTFLSPAPVVAPDKAEEA